MAVTALGFAFAAGLASFFSPCVLPLVPVYLAYVTGTTYKELISSSPRWRVASHALAFIAGFSLVFIALGASATLLGQWLFEYRSWIEKAGGILLIVLGLWMAGLIPAGFLYKDIRVHFSERPAGFVGSVVVGAAFAAGWTPCVGPVLASILLLASRSGSVGQGVLLLAFYSLGLAVPLFLCALLLDRAFSAIKAASPVLPVFEKILATMLVLLGFLMAGGWFSRVSSWALGYFAGWTRLFSELGL